MDFAGPIETGVPTSNLLVILLVFVCIVGFVIWWVRHDDE